MRMRRRGKVTVLLFTASLAAGVALMSASTTAAQEQPWAPSWRNFTVDPADHGVGPTLLSAEGIYPGGGHVVVAFVTQEAPGRVTVEGTYARDDQVLQIRQTYRHEQGQLVLDARYEQASESIRVLLSIDPVTQDSSLKYFFPGIAPIELVIKACQLKNRDALDGLRDEALRHPAIFNTLRRYINDLSTLPVSTSRTGDSLIALADPLPKKDDPCTECIAECGHYNCNDCDPFSPSLLCQTCWATCNLGCLWGCQ